ncbi:DEAD-box ATP-dependent RNA helicase [Malaciobacter marinus]|uniref:DEAD-box ATP-dependent RNA helicase RhpA n=1 Tax=Malaciobacter marinus TaxID=505249 RepID=A0A347TIG3_9BACT|nr:MULTISPECIES: DEAD/DEAH box helicase [Malaciobacter]AXX86391.1 DEAD-box ATP-dependent RNA helicase [Malaciobacter marinus]PHO16366.1 ATP-dependent RNA helicase RhlE [Malaciobacter marinus]RYA22819.1 ATP-dependent RNA helicase RhlE [Malaciobacter halophilus]
MSFSQLGLNPNILKAVKEQGYTSPTPIQKESIPVILNHKDVLAAAQTGTGKTAAFTLPLLEKMSQKPNKKGQKSYIKALILAPTRELALQVSENIQTYSKYLSLKTAVIFGGVGISPQKASLRKGVDIVIATPGRLLDHMSQKTIDLSRVEFLVLDEADRMLDMGFIHDIKKVVASIPNKRQTLLFSATFSPEIKKLSNSFLDNPKLIEVARSNALSEQVSQVVHYVQKDKKKNLLAFLIHTQKWNQVLVFTRTKHGANKLSEFLNKSNIPSLAIHGNKSQGARTSALSNFKSKKIRVLVATDIAARGIDIELLPHVVNFELPNVPEDYVHRIGRTGRAGNNGIALSLVCDEESQYLKDIERLTKISIPVKDIEGFTVPLLKKVNKKSDSKNRTNRRDSNKKTTTNHRRSTRSRNNSR